jgi:two-component system, NtrC family, sensor histidine kinase PilS
VTARAVGQRIRSERLPAPRRILGWVYVGRLCLGTGIFLAAALVWRSVPAETTLLATLVLVGAAAFTGASFWYTHVAGRAPGRSYLYWQVVFDVVLVGAVVHLTGGPESEFTPLFVLVIVAAAILLPFIGGILIGVLVSLVYFADLVWTVGRVDPASLLQVMLFAAVALATGYLGDRMRRTGVVLGEVETELRRLQVSTDDVMAGIATGLLTVDAEERLAFLNPAAAEMLGLAATDWLGRPVLDRLEQRAPGLGEVVRRTLRTGTPVRRFETGATDAGLVFGVSTTLISRGDDEPPSVTAIFQDITERVRMEQLSRRAERLSAIAELSASLAHEIKNPLASIRSATEQLTGDGIEAEDRRVLGALVVRESDRLSRLLSEFIDFARVRIRAAGPVEVAPLLRHAVDVARAHPDAAGVTFEVRIAPTAERCIVVGDEDLLHRAVFNLALNGAQWAGATGAVRVEAEPVETDLLAPGRGAATAVRIRVSDTGPGIPAAHAEHVFDPFFTERPGGTGLGLALVQRAAEAHGGAVLVEPSAEVPGATLALYLPAATAAGEAPDGTAAAPAARGASPPHAHPSTP